MHFPQRLTLAIVLLVTSPTSYAPPQPPLPASISAENGGTTLDTQSPQETVVFPDGDLRSKCRFEAVSRTYDLCPLMEAERQVRIEMEVPEQRDGLEITSREYRIMLGTNRVVTGPGVKKPPSWTWVFLTEWDQWSAPHLHGPRGASLPQGEGDKVISAQQFKNSGTEFVISMTREKQQVGVDFAFICAEEDSKLEFLNKRDGTHHFAWRTRHACPISTSPGEGFFAMENGSEGEEGKTEEGELRNGELPVGGVSRRWTGVILLLIVCLLVSTSILISSPRARQYTFTRLQTAGYTILPLFSNIKHLTKPVAKHFPHFKVGERRLVRWAQEDMGLDGDEDLMVNSGSETGHGWNNLEMMDEYIPLKGSPTRSTFMGRSQTHSTYGSVHFEGLDVDESGVDTGPPPSGGLRNLIRSASETASIKVKGLFRR